MVCAVKLRVSLALIVVALLAGLLPLAYASPPDQTWLGGFFDDRDFDDVVIAVMSIAKAVESAPTAAFNVFFGAIATMAVFLAARPPATRLPAARPIRAGPAH
jgi:hypothetical protein